jgi:hypothetical protein
MPEICKSRTGKFISRSFSRSNYEVDQPSIKSHSMLENVNIDETLISLKKDGFYLGINLSQDVVQEIRNFAIHTPCYGNRKTNLGFYYPDKKQAQAKQGSNFDVGSYDNTALNCPGIKKLETDSILLEIATKYLKAEPVHQGNHLWWSFAVESSLFDRRRADQVFHSDLQNSRCLRFSFYLTDVDLCCSPHVCVRGSHIKKKLSHLFLRRGLSEQKIRDYYGYENIVPICGKAGLGFVEDTLCCHKANPPGSNDRLILQIEFAARDYKRPNDLRDASQLEFI